eukprot:1157346-Pelagomonas_calceolata.AAC.17
MQTTSSQAIRQYKPFVLKVCVGWRHEMRLSPHNSVWCLQPLSSRQPLFKVSLGPEEHCRKAGLSTGRVHQQPGCSLSGAYTFATASLQIANHHTHMGAHDR